MLVALTAMFALGKMGLPSLQHSSLIELINYFTVSKTKNATAGPGKMDFAINADSGHAHFFQDQTLKI